MTNEGKWDTVDRTVPGRSRQGHGSRRTVAAGSPAPPTPPGAVGTPAGDPSGIQLTLFVVFVIVQAELEPASRPGAVGDQLELPGLEAPTPRDHLDAMRDHLAGCRDRKRSA